MNIMIKQESGFAIMTKGSWKSHLCMVKMNFLQEGLSDQEAQELVDNYINDFEISNLSANQVSSFKNFFALEVNESRKILSTFGVLNHF